MSSRMFVGEPPDALLDRLTDLALTSTTSEAFFRSILQTAIGATCASAGAIWSVVGGNFRLEQEVGLVPLGIGSDAQLQVLHEDALEQATKGHGLHASEVLKRSYASREYRFFGCRDGDAAFLIIELVHQADSIEEADEGTVSSFMSALSEIARDFRHAQALRRLQSEEHLWRDLKAILPQLHSSVHLEDLAFVVANEGRAFVGCDRLSLVQVNGNRASILAISGVANIDQRSPQVLALESLVSVVAKGGHSLRYPFDIVEIPQLEDSLNRYLDTTSCEGVWVVLLSSAPSKEDHPRMVDPPRYIGAMVLEDFSVKDPSDASQRCSLLLEHVDIAFRKAFELQSMPLRHLSLRLKKWSKLCSDYRIRLLTTFAACAATVVLALVIPADLNIDASGTIQPANIRHLYAPANGEVVQIHVAHQSEVQKGQLLLEVRSRDLELRKEELVTLHASSLERLRSIEIARLQNRRVESSESLDSQDLSASEAELREVVASQLEQLSILDGMLNALRMVSPMNGQIISWDPSETLEHRPVQQGQKLLSVAELNGDKKLQLRVRDEDARYIIKAYEKETSGIRVTFSIASDPGVKHTARVTQVGTTVETVSNEGPTLRVDAWVDSATIPNIRPGATVNARIHCGKSSIGYVWTRRIIDYLYLRFL